MEEIKMDTWIRFMAPVVPQSATALLKVIDQKIKEKKQNIHLMLSSPGGSVFHGLSIYNFLCGAPINVTTYNFGSVDSIGVVIFCAGKKRISVPHARFLIHGVSFNINGNHTFDEKDLEERIKSLKIDYQNISRVIADTTTRDVDSIMNDMNNRTTLNPDEAKKYGLVHEIKSELFPMGADFITINEDITMQQAMPPGFPFPVIQHFTTPNIQAFTTSQTHKHGTYF